MRAVLLESADAIAQRTDLLAQITDPEHQRAGIGSVLMDAAEEYAAAKGAAAMDIKVVNLRAELFGYYPHRGLRG